MEDTEVAGIIFAKAVRFITGSLRFFLLIQSLPLRHGKLHLGKKPLCVLYPHSNLALLSHSDRF